MILTTDYQRSGLENLLEYMSRNKGDKIALEDSRGRELAKADVKALIEKSEEYGIERHFIVSPHPDADYSDHELARNTRMTLREWQADRPSTEFAYAVHSEHQNPHTHVAVTGRERDLWMDKEDVEQFRETARETFRETERLQHKELESSKDPREKQERPEYLNPDVEKQAEPELESEPEPTSEPHGGGE